MQTAVIVLAAGAGTRMKSKTPKVLHTLAGRSMLAHSLHAATSLNPTHLVTVVGHDRERVTEAVNAVAGELDRSVTVAVQDEQKGTGHAVSCGLEGLPADFLRDRTRHSRPTCLCSTARPSQTSSPSTRLLPRPR